MKVSDYIAENISTLLFNASVKYDQTIIPGVVITLYIHPSKDLVMECWAESILKYAAEGDLRLSRQHSLSSPLSTTAILNSQAPRGGQTPKELAPQRQICYMWETSIVYHRTALPREMAQCN